MPIQCNDCGGTGKVPNTPRGAANICPSCVGKGRIERAGYEEKQLAGDEISSLAEILYKEYKRLGESGWNGLPERDKQRWRNVASMAMMVIEDTK